MSLRKMSDRRLLREYLSRCLFCEPPERLAAEAEVLRRMSASNRTTSGVERAANDVPKCVPKRARTVPVATD